MIPNAYCDRADDTSVDVLSHPKLKEADAVRELCVTLPKQIAEHMHHAQIVGDALVLHLAHPAIIAEFERQRDEILNKMRKIYKERGFVKVIRFTMVKTKLHHLPKKKKEQREIDSSSGEWEIKTSDNELRKKFEAIQKRIREHNGGVDV